MRGFASETGSGRGLARGDARGLWLRLGAAGMIIAWCGACQRSEDGLVAITHTREAAPPPTVPKQLTLAQQLGVVQQQLPHNHPPVGQGDASGAAEGADTQHALQWQAPDGWSQGAARPMRLVTFTSGAAGDVECYVAELAGTGGGAEANFNRWRAQLGKPPLASGEFAALPTIPILGGEAPFLEVTGTYRGMGDTEKANSKLLGTLTTVGGQTFFVKMVGPASTVDAQQSAFKEFCKSLSLK